VSSGRGAVAYGVSALAFGGASACGRRAASLRPAWDISLGPANGRRP
jgi:hypothetical protein